MHICNVRKIALLILFILEVTLVLKPDSLNDLQGKVCLR